MASCSEAPLSIAPARSRGFVSLDSTFHASPVMLALLKLTDFHCGGGIASALIIVQLKLARQEDPVPSFAPVSVLAVKSTRFSLSLPAKLVHVRSALVRSAPVKVNPDKSTPLKLAPTSRQSVQSRAPSARTRSSGRTTRLVVF